MSYSTTTLSSSVACYSNSYLLIQLVAAIFAIAFAISAVVGLSSAFADQVPVIADYS